MANSLAEILGHATVMDGLVNEIANASRDQSAGIAHVNGAIVAMDGMTQSNAGIAVDVAAAAAQRSAAAQRMRDTVESLHRSVGTKETRGARAASVQDGVALPAAQVQTPLRPPALGSARRPAA